MHLFCFLKKLSGVRMLTTFYLFFLLKTFFARIGRRTLLDGENTSGFSAQSYYL